MDDNEYNTTLFLLVDFAHWLSLVLARCGLADSQYEEYGCWMRLVNVLC